MKDIKVLIVDDNNLNREIMKDMLEDEGCNQIIMAKSAKEAFEYLGINNDNEEKKLPVDLILSDLIMPNIDGVEFCKEIRLRKRFDNIPIIVVTASNDLKDIEKTFEIGVSDYITKPIKKVEFITRIKNALKLKKERERRIQKEKELYDDLKMAKEVQNNVLPLSVKEEKISIKGYYKSADILGGDLYYWQKIDDDKYGVILLDVMGHGIATSLICMYIRSLLPGLIKRVKEPRIVMEELNKHINHFNKSVKSDIDYYFTAIYILIDNSKKTIEYVNAGHPSGIIFYEDGTSLFMDKGSLPIGVVSRLKIDTGLIPYNMPFEMLIYSDGVSDMLGCTKNKVLEKINQIRLNHNLKIDNSFFDDILIKIKSFKGNDDVSIVNIIGR